MTPTRKIHIAVIPGDGIGQEVIPEGLKVLEAVSSAHAFRCACEAFPWGSDYYLKHGAMMPADGLDTLLQADG